MKKSKILPILLAFFAAITLTWSACTNDDDSADKNTDTLEITSPGVGAIFALGDTVKLEAIATGAQELHGWELVLRKKADNAVVYEKEKHTHGTSLQISEEWVNNVSHHTDMVLEVTIALDHSGSNLLTKTVNFHCHPN